MPDEIIDYDKLDDKTILTRLLTCIKEMNTEDRIKVLNFIAQKGLTERRNYPRQRCDLTVSFDNSNTSCEGFIKNLSASGVFIRTKKVFNLGEHVKLSFTLPTEQNPLIATGKVVRKEDDGFGVQFDITDFETGLISSLILLHSE